jgi:hypothetical protein
MVNIAVQLASASDAHSPVTGRFEILNDHRVVVDDCVNGTLKFLGVYSLKHAVSYHDAILPPTHAQSTFVCHRASILMKHSPLCWQLSSWRKLGRTLCSG